jgi:hypothetical protein
VEEARETLEREARQRRPAGLAAIAAGVLTLTGSVVNLIQTRDLPTGDARVRQLLPSLEARLQGEEPAPGLLAQQVAYIGDHLALYLLSGALLGLAYLLLLPPLRALWVATQARVPTVGRSGIIATVAGALLAGVGFLVYSVTFASEAASFADAAQQTSGGARDAINAGTVTAAQLIFQLGRFALAVAFVMVALQAMRAGLLTRFLGILGIVAGVTFVFPIDQPGLVRSFWLIAVGFILLGRWPSPLPAWQTGRAEPWPSRQDLRERREAGSPPPAREADDARDGASEPAAVAARRKRKRRR